MTTEGAILAVLTEADELADTLAMHEEASAKLGLRATRASKITADDLRKRERELRQVAALLARHSAPGTVTVDGVVYGENTVRLLQQQVNQCHERGFIDHAGNVRHSAPGEGTIPPNHIRLPDGRDVRVLGTLPMTEDGCFLARGCIYKAGFNGGKPHIFVYPAEARWVGLRPYIAHVWGEGAEVAYATREAAEQWFANNGHERPSIDENVCLTCGHVRTRGQECHGWCAAEAAKGGKS